MLCHLSAPDHQQTGYQLSDTSLLNYISSGLRSLFLNWDLCSILYTLVNSNWNYSPETVKLGCDLCDLDLWPLTLTFCMDLTLVIGNNSWKFHDDTMMETQSKRCEVWQTADRQTENTICRAASSQLKIADFDPNWAFPDCNPSLNSPMVLKWCTKLNVA